MKKQPIWHPPAMIPVILTLSQGLLDSSREQLANMEALKGKPYVLSDKEIQRCLKLYREMNEDIWVFLELCKRWNKFVLTKEQKNKALEIETITQEREKINKSILSLVEKYKHYTIEKIMEMGPDEVALSILSGKIDSSFTFDPDILQ